jgi:hypothetical protein
MDSHTEPDAATQAEDAAEASARHGSDRLPTDEEAAAAEEHAEQLDDAARADVARHEQEMMEIGAAAKGEGKIG